MTWLTNTFSVVAHLRLIPYYSLIKLFLNALPNNSLPLLYVIIVGLGYLNNHDLFTGFDIVADYLPSYCTITNHPVAGSIIFIYFSMIW